MKFAFCKLLILKRAISVVRGLDCEYRRWDVRKAGHPPALPNAVIYKDKYITNYGKVKSNFVICVKFLVRLGPPLRTL